MIPAARVPRLRSSFNTIQLATLWLPLQGGAKVETLKTAVIVVLLLAVLYGVYLVLNKPEPTPPGDLAWEAQAMQPLQVDLGGSGETASFSDASATALEPLGLTPAPNDTPAADLVDPPSPPDIMTPPPSQAFNDETSPSDTPASPERPDWRSEADWPNLTAQAAPPPSELTADATAETNSPSADSVYATNPPAGDWPVQEAPSTGDDAVAEMAAVPQASLATAAEITAAETASVPAETAEESSPTHLSIAENALLSANAKIAEEQWYDALLTLSMVYGSPDLGAEDVSRLQDLMDPLAGKVIYSVEHLIEAPYKVARGDTLEDIADRYQVPWQLLANINALETPDFLEPGLELKVVRGPFRAEVDLQRKELTVYAGRLYAGRFPVTLGTDPTPQPGDYRVYNKQPGRTYYAGDGRTIPAEDVNNPYGKVWIDLGGDVCIHGSGEAAVPGQGCISLSPIDANDLYGILSKGSAVSILR
jgi:lipoprotein-anchoring transpeptidase ErfK/SrfK